MYFKEASSSFKTYLDQLKGKKVVVLGHVRPDGDCIGSQVALVRVMRAIGIDAIGVNHNEVPSVLKSFVADTPFFSSKDYPVDAIPVSVDCADRKRFGLEFHETVGEVFLNIDHHISNKKYGENNIIIDTCSAAGEILAGLFLDNQLPIDPVTAQALYIGIATDTGQFRYNSTTQMTFEICAKLMSLGASPSAASKELYENERPEKIQLLGEFLHTVEFYCDNRVCVGYLYPDVWDKTGANKDDTEGFVDFTRDIAGVEIGVLLEQNGNMTKGSFRAKDPKHRVDEIAKLFNGGGHACAAGFNPGKDLQNIKDEVIQTLQNHFSKIDAE